MARSKFVYDALIKLWPLGKVVYWMGNRPLVGPLVRPFINAASDEAMIIPVEEVVHGTESVALPYPLLTPLVERARVRFILDECMCRRGENCQTYPHDLGCLFLGDGAAEINPALGRLASVDEALAHVQRAMDVGLVPLVVHAAFDAWVLHIPHERMLTVCFCCDCCCAVRQGLRLGPPSFGETVVRLPGLRVTVGPECVACGQCVEVCHVRAISLHNGRAHISDQCKGCGRCAAVCPTGAITLHLAEDVDVRGSFIAGIDQLTDIGLAGGA